MLFPDVGCAFVLFINLLNLLPEDRRVALASIFNTLHDQCIIITEIALGTITVFTNIAFSSVTRLFCKIKETVSADFSNLDSADLNVVFKKGEHTFLLVDSYVRRIIKRIILSKLNLFPKSFDFLDWDFPTRTLLRSRNEDVPELLKKACEEGYLTESDLASSTLGQQAGEIVNEWCDHTLPECKENKSYSKSHPLITNGKMDKHETVKDAFMPKYRAVYKYPLFPKSATVQKLKYPLFSSYSTRLATFRYCYFLTNHEWCAKLGFFCRGYGDAVCCYECGVAIAHWCTDDDLLLKHNRFSPYCQHMTLLANEESLISYRSEVQRRQEKDSKTGASGIRQEKQSSQWDNKKIRSPEYSSYNVRLSTFARFPDISGLNVHIIAEAGFYYTGQEDIVRCYACDGGLKKWVPGDNAWEEHYKWFPDCSYLEQSNYNRKSEGSKTKEPLQKMRGPESRDIGTGGCRDIQQAEETYVHGGNCHENRTSPRSPAFQCMKTRLSTFNKFPNFNGINIRDLANAGFYYTGVNDKVRCFWCDVGLREWEYGDDPYRKHAKYHPDCYHLRLIKGQRFIAYVQEKERQNQQSHDATSATARMSSRLEDIPGITDESNFGAEKTIGQETDIDMNKPAVLAVLEFGYSTNKVKMAIMSLRKKGYVMLTAEAIVNELLSFEDERIPLPKYNRDFHNNKVIPKERNTIPPKLDVPLNSLLHRTRMKTLLLKKRAREFGRLPEENKMLTSILM